MAGLFDTIVDIQAAGGLGAWWRRRRGRDAASRVLDPATLKRIESRAYHIWEQEGRPDGRSDEHWARAMEMETAGAFSASPTSSLAQDIERLQFQSDLAEVQLLLDFISGRPDKAFASGTDAAPPAAGVLPPRFVERITPDDLKKVASIRFPPNKSIDANADDAALLLQMRDRLNQFVFPASGLTVAFTLMTWAPLRGAHKWVDVDWARWKLANQAFPRLQGSIRQFRWSAFALSLLAILVTLVTVWTSNEVSDGQAKIDRLQALDKQQTTMRDLVAQIANAPAGAPAGSPSAIAVLTTANGANIVPGVRDRVYLRYCDQPKALPPVVTPHGALQTFDSPLQYETCDKFAALQQQTGAAVIDMESWWRNWNSRTALLRVAGCWMSLGGWNACLGTSQLRDAATFTPAAEADGTIMSAPPHFALVADTLADLTNIWLPVAYGFIGAMVAALRGIYGKISRSTLAPWDTRLMWTKVMLGIIAGACIGLFFSPSGTTVQAAAGVGTLTLSAVAFIAGYAVDGLFAMLDEIIKRLFRTDRPA